jgi:C-terminal processing protease CtpA/Prc
MAPHALFDLLRGMLEPLHDAHTSIDAKGLDGEGIGWAGLRTPEGTILDESDFPRTAQAADAYLEAPPSTFCNGKVQAGTLRGGVAYLRIVAFSDYEQQGRFDSGLRLLDQALDQIFAGASSWRGLVLDVRVNFGGFDPYGLAVAARLTRAPYEAYVKQARADPVDATKWTAPQPTFVRPRAPGFSGAMVLLTGPNTISAGETFAMATMGRAPRVPRIGQSTQGVFSDVMERLLPNGWRFGVPNERYVTAGRSYDGAGVPPTIEVPVFAKADLDAKRDPAIEAALRELGAR